MIDWTRLRPTQKGLAVEGANDKTFVEAFLDAGESQGLWNDWRAKVVVERAGKVDNVIREVADTAHPGQVWGLIDRDWRTEDEIDNLQKDYPHLLVLPRIMVENYLIEPGDLLSLLPPARRASLDDSKLRGNIVATLSEWVKHGALSCVLHENGAHEFCRGNEGYPKKLLDNLITDKKAIFTHLEGWHKQLEPHNLLSLHDARIADFQRKTAKEHFWHCINGKMFFNQVVVAELNKQFGQRSRDDWFAQLLVSATECPSDLIPLFNQLV